MNIPYTKHDITDADIEAVEKVLRNGPLTNGPQVSAFEDKFSTLVNAKYAAAVSSGTAALHLAVTALGVKPGQTVLVPSLTFAATANVVLYAGGEVEFVDIDPDTLLIDLKLIEQRLKTNPDKYAGVIAVDFAGLPVDIPQLSETCKKYGVWLIEDASHSLGASFAYGEEKLMVGGSKYADAVTFSFHPAKHITSGEGGMVTTPHKHIHERIALLRSHAMSKSKVNTDTEGWRYDIDILGYNYRLSDINAALGLSQLDRLKQNVAQRRTLAEEYRSQLKDSSVLLPPDSPSSEHAYHLFVIQAPRRMELFNYLKQCGIFAQVHYVPLHMQALYKRSAASTPLIHTESYYERCLSIPMFPSLKANEQDHVIKSLTDFLEK